MQQSHNLECLRIQAIPGYCPSTVSCFIMLEGANQWEKGLGVKGGQALQPRSFDYYSKPSKSKSVSYVCKHSWEQNQEYNKKNPLVSSTFNLLFLEMLLRVPEKSHGIGT